ncbi:MAG TPA: FHA domain-containing protein [Pyrinomonadaceae bacterium]|nr:FHA domain-containing protein [Pyrinomonadaceae bacterium]
MAFRLIITRQGAPTAAPPLAERRFDESIVTIGRDEAATLRLEDPSVAPEQAIILDEDGQLLFINRAPGTRLNGETLAREVRRTLSEGDRLQVGPFLLSVALDGGRPTQPTLVQEPESRPVPTPAATDDAGGRAGATEDAPQRSSFAAILDSLRTEEDRFYFQIENGFEGRRRVVIESAEMLIGWDETGRNLTCEAAHVVAPRAVARKDWSGVLVQPTAAGMLAVNGETVESVRRLRNGDRLTLLPTPAVADPSVHFLVFHEPASLVVLDALLPQQLPPPVAPPAPPSAAPSAAEATQALTPVAPAAVAAAPRRPKLLSPERRFFGYFTLGEVLVMVVGTLVAAVIIFLILEYT